MSRVAVFGDVGIDNYLIGTIGSMSAEAPVPVVRIHRTLQFPAMAGNVVRILQTLVPELIVDLHLSQTPNLPLKNRLMTEDGVQVSRWDIDDFCTPMTTDEWYTFECGPRADAIVVCDYAKGSIDGLAINRLRSYCEDGIPVYIDTKNDPYAWIGLRNVTLFPNGSEWSKWSSHYQWLPRVIHKMGAAGLELVEFGRSISQWLSTATSVQSVCGAGDTILAGYVSSQLQGHNKFTSLTYAMSLAGRMVSARFDERYTALKEGYDNTSNYSIQRDSIPGTSLPGLVGSSAAPSDSEPTGAGNQIPQSDLLRTSVGVWS